MLLSMVTGQVAFGHDFWIEPSSFRPEIASSVRLMLRVGEDFSGRPVPRRQDRIERFVLSGPAGERTIAGIESRDPAGFARIDAPGAYVAAYQSRRSPITLPGSRFEKYLAAEGLDAVLEARRRRGDSDAEGREVFSRCAKTVLRVAGSEPVDSDPALIGCPFELILEAGSEAPAAGRTVAVRAFYRGQPVEGAKIVALARSASGRHIAVQSDATGAAEFRIDKAGPWLVKAVHMVEAPSDIDADWESFWASVTFEAEAR